MNKDTPHCQTFVILFCSHNFLDCFPHLWHIIHLTFICGLIHNSVKRIAVILLVPILLFNTIGYYLVYYGDLIEARHEAAVMIWGHEALGDRLVSLSFPLINGKPAADGLTFTDDDEFTYQGRMYDVISSSQSRGEVVFKCYTDSKETALNQDLSLKINSDSDTPAQNHKNNSTLKEFSKDYTQHAQLEYSFIPAFTDSYIKTNRTERKT